MNSHGKFGGATRRRFFAICDPPPPPAVRGLSFGKQLINATSSLEQTQC